MVEVIVPYTRLGFDKNSTEPACGNTVLSFGAPTYKLQLLIQISNAAPYEALLLGVVDSITWTR